jgi:hypothetical protein
MRRSPAKALRRYKITAVEVWTEGGTPQEHASEYHVATDEALEVTLGQPELDRNGQEFYWDRLQGEGEVAMRLYVTRER